jgi:phosphatidylserine/phosphatidylglycerophosphate/cardiolipin synthase-like enzyme
MGVLAKPASCYARAVALLRQDELDDILQKTLDDLRLSRTERRALGQVFLDLKLDDEDRAFIRHRVFAHAREHIRAPAQRKVLEWAEEVIKLLHSKLERDPTISEVYFSPGDECRMQISRLLRQAKRTIDICVFTITDDRLAAEVLEAHRRGVAIRIVSDDEKIYDEGSDVPRLAHAGIEVCVDESEHHMHHKFAIFDRATVLTGSYNWTRSAARFNRENLMVSDDVRIVAAYQQNFDDLWETLHKVTRITKGSPKTGA